MESCLTRTASHRRRGGLYFTYEKFDMVRMRQRMFSALRIPADGRSALANKGGVFAHLQSIFTFRDGSMVGEWCASKKAIRLSQRANISTSLQLSIVDSANEKSTLPYQNSSSIGRYVFYSDQIILPSRPLSDAIIRPARPNAAKLPPMTCGKMSAPHPPISEEHLNVH